MTLQLGQRLVAMYDPLRTDDLIPEARICIGALCVFDVGWMLEPDDGKPWGETRILSPYHARELAPDFVEVITVPLCDLRVFEVAVAHWTLAQARERLDFWRGQLPAILGEVPTG